MSASDRLKVLAGHLSASGLSKAEILELRTSRFSEAQSVSYANTEPLLVMGGSGAFLFDEKGKAYLDTRNNVCHVGHQHPAVVRAVAPMPAPSFVAYAARTP